MATVDSKDLDDAPQQLRNETGLRTPGAASGTTLSTKRATYEHSALSETVYGVFAVFVTGLASVVAFGHAWLYGLDLFFPTLMFLMLIPTALGVTAGLHRLLTHRAFEAVRWLRIGLALAGAASGQGYLIRWIFEHRVHHRMTDVPGDPHSPYFEDARQLGSAEGFMHAHVLWLFKPRPPIDPKVIPDIVSDPAMLWIDRYSPHIAVGTIVLAGLVSLLYHAVLFGVVSAQMFWLGVLWGGFVRIFLMYHITWSVNSVCHMFGSRLRPSDDLGKAKVPMNATNNLIFGILALGEGFHANHHAHAASARHGFGFAQPDITWMFIRMAQKLGWVSKVKLPPEDKQRAMRAT